MTQNNVVLELAHEVARLRSEVTNRADHLARLRTDWEAEHQPLITELAEAKVELTDTETELRRVVEEVHHETGEKAFPAGIKIRNKTVTTYDADAVRSWAYDNAPHLLVVDKKAFEKHAKTHGTELGSSAVVGQALIPSDLSGLLNGGES